MDNAAHPTAPVNEPANENEPTTTHDGPTPEAPEPEKSGPQAEIARLTDELAKARDQWVRAVAEADNIRKRAQRDMEDNAKYAVTSFARDMVSVLENLQRASDSIPANDRESNLLFKTLSEGVDLTLKELLNIFTQNGIRRVDPMDAKFDHNLHQAVAQVERDDVAPGTVVQVVQAGYTIHDRLLRPAMVVVAKAGA